MITRMRHALRDIIDICNTDPWIDGEKAPTEEDWRKLIGEIEDVAYWGLDDHQQQD